MFLASPGRPQMVRMISIQNLFDTITSSNSHPIDYEPSTVLQSHPAPKEKVEEHYSAAILNIWIKLRHGIEHSSTNARSGNELSERTSVIRWEGEGNESVND